MTAPTPEDFGKFLSTNSFFPTYLIFYKAAIRSLAYPEMHHRRYDTQPAYKNTCTWILEHASYCKWISESCGLLWIKGKPGAGKTTLMEFLLRVFEQQQASHQ